MKNVKAIVLSAVFLLSFSLFAAEEEAELDFVSTEVAFAAAEKNKGWVLVYVDWGR